MPSLCLSNDFIARDEALHFEFTVFLFHKIRRIDAASSREFANEWRAFVESTYLSEMLHEAYLVEEAFWVYAFGDDVTTIAGEKMATSTEAEKREFSLTKVLEYIRYVFRGMCAALGIPAPSWCKTSDTSPFPFMHLISMASRTNFFEKVGTEYSLTGVYNKRAHEGVAANSPNTSPLKKRIKLPHVLAVESPEDAGVRVVIKQEMTRLAGSILPHISVNMVCRDKYDELVSAMIASKAVPPSYGGDRGLWISFAHECSMLSPYDYRYSYLAALMLKEVNYGAQRIFTASRKLVSGVYQSLRKAVKDVDSDDSSDDDSSDDDFGEHEYLWDARHSANQAAFFMKYPAAADEVTFVKLDATNDDTFFEALSPLIDGKVQRQGQRYDVKYRRNPKELLRYHPQRQSYLAMKTLQESYLLKERLEGSEGGVVYEHIEHFYLRIAAYASDNTNEMDAIMQGLTSQKFIFGSSILFNAGRYATAKKGVSLANCYLLEMGDSVKKIMACISEMALLSKSTGGIGVHLSDVRCRGSPISSGQNKSSGILPLMQTINGQATYINQGGKRQGSIAVYLEPWHADIVEFLRCRLGHGVDEGGRCRNLFTALWMPDLFFRRLRSDPDTLWSLFDPAAHPLCRKLVRTWGAQFEEIYHKCEELGLAKTQVSCKFIWDAIVRSLMETGTPYLMNKDACNELSQHRHRGTIRGSNLCAEIVQLADKKTTAVCTLASVNLLQFAASFDNACKHPSADERQNLEDFYRSVKSVVYGLNRLLEKNCPPSEKAKEGNSIYAALGIGVQGFAYLLQELRVAFESEECRKLNAMIFEHLYIAAVEASHAYLKDECGGRLNTREWFDGSPAQKGYLHPHLWQKRRIRQIKAHMNIFSNTPKDEVRSGFRAQLSELADRVATDGMANSLLIALMPTASTSQILDNSEGVEPLHSNIFKKQTLTGDNVVVNRFLQTHLQELGLWSEEMANRVERSGGSIQAIEEIPLAVRAIYKTAWEINPRCLAQLAAQRAPWVDQSQSRNVYLSGLSAEEVGAELLYAQELDLKTVVYYLRTRPAHQAIAWSNPEWHTNLLPKEAAAAHHPMDAVCCNDEECCTSCSG
jgi:ribonucleoside-diphosphate reductase alpha subunit